MVIGIGFVALVVLALAAMSKFNRSPRISSAL